MNQASRDLKTTPHSAGECLGLGIAPLEQVHSHQQLFDTAQALRFGNLVELGIDGKILFTVRSISLVSAWGMTPITRLTASGSRDTSWPAMMAFPLVTGISVVIMRMSVLLPAPLGPSKPKISPSATSKVMPPTASKSP